MPKRRANGEGNIRKRKDGRWEGRYTVGHDPETGKAIIKNVLGKTQAEVVDIKTVSGMLGHFSAGFTLDTYAHVTTSAKREAAKTMGNILSGAV